MVKIGQRPDPIIPVAFASAQTPDFGFEILELADVLRRVGRAHLASPRRLQFCQLMVLNAGSAVQEIDFVQYEVLPGMVVFTLPDQVQRLVLSKDCVGSFLLFKPEFVSPANHGVDLRDIAPVVKSTPAIATALRGLTEEYALAHRDRNARSIIMHEAVALLLRLRRESDSVATSHGHPTAAHALVRRFEILLDNTFREHRSAAMLARELGCSEKTLRRACLTATGKPPKAIIQQRVALEAKRILSHTDEPVKSIANQLGFTEPTNFVKFFRRVTGDLPGAFRSRLRSATPETRVPAP